MKCPHCSVAFHSAYTEDGFVRGSDGSWKIKSQRCPTCGKTIISADQFSVNGGFRATFLVVPRGAIRPIAPEVTDPYRKDFQEAGRVLPDSEAASAALSRRCIQSILRDKADTKARDLCDQIEEVISSGRVPSHICESLHAVRNIGNFGAHPIKSQSTGTIVEVEPGEAEWNLDVIESLFDFYFVQPALTAKRKAELNKKLKDAGKAEIS